MRLVLIFVGLAIALAIPFLIWGDRFAHTFSREGTTDWLRGYGHLAWLAAIGLLAADLVLPVPATAVMAALGIGYGPVLGGFIGAAGSFLAGTLAYGACRLIGQRAARVLVDETDLARGEALFARAGGWAVALSRWMPLLPEVVSCLAGLTRMPARRFFAALACGCVPMAFTFASLGHAGADQPAIAILVSAAAPLLLWPVADRLTRTKPPA